MINDPSNPLPTPPAFVRFAAVGVSLLLGLSCLPVLYLTLLGADRTLWFSTMFELLVLGACVVGVLAGLGRFRDGWALALACSAGTVLVCGVFAFVEIRANFRTDADIAPLLKPILAARLAAAALIGLLASVAVWSRNPRSWRLAFVGIAMLLPVIGVVVLARLGTGLPLSTPRETPGAEAVRIAVWLLAGVIGIGLVSAGGHLLIRSYELGRPENAGTEAPKR